MTRRLLPRALPARAPRLTACRERNFGHTGYPDHGPCLPQRHRPRPDSGTRPLTQPPEFSNLCRSHDGCHGSATMTPVCVGRAAPRRGAHQQSPRHPHASRLASGPVPGSPPRLGTGPYLLSSAHRRRVRLRRNRRARCPRRPAQEANRQRGEHAAMAAGRRPCHGEVHVGESRQALESHLTLASHDAGRWQVFHHQGTITAC